MKQTSIFQIIVLCGFSLFVMVGLIVVAVYSSHGASQGLKQASVTVWGTLDATSVRAAIGQAMRNQQNITVSYVQKSDATFDTDLLEAIATGNGPDVIIVRDDTLASSLNKIAIVPYQYYPARTFIDSFMQEGQMFMLPSGIAALPFAIDPLVMYWNRDLFSQAGLANPPHFWDELFAEAEQLTKRDATGAITQSGVALGTFDNIDHAKDILSAMLIQSGNTIASLNAQTNSVDVSLLNAPTPAASILSFYTQFADQQKPVYSWNLALTDSQSVFLSNRLAAYFGFSSEFPDIRAKSPNLNFDVTYLPQSRAGQTSGTLARLYGLAVLKSSKDPISALTAIKLMTGADSIQAFITNTAWAPVRKDVSVPASNPYQAVFAQSALVSFTWADPNRSASDTAFRDMINSVNSGFTNAQDAVSTAAQALQYAAPHQ